MTVNTIATDDSLATYQRSRSSPIVVTSLRDPVCVYRNNSEDALSTSRVPVVVWRQHRRRVKVELFYSHEMLGPRAATAITVT